MKLEQNDANVIKTNLAGIAAVVGRSLEATKQELEDERQRLREAEAERQLNSLVAKYSNITDEFERYESAAVDADAADKPLLLLQIKVELQVSQSTPGTLPVAST